MTDREMILVASLTRAGERLVAGDHTADRQLRMDAAALVRWHGWTYESVSEWLAIVVGPRF